MLLTEICPEEDIFVMGSFNRLYWSAICAIPLFFILITLFLYSTINSSVPFNPCVVRPKGSISRKGRKRRRKTRQTKDVYTVCTDFQVKGDTVNVNFDSYTVLDVVTNPLRTTRQYLDLMVPTQEVYDNVNYNGFRELHELMCS